MILPTTRSSTSPLATSVQADTDFRGQARRIGMLGPVVSGSSRPMALQGADILIYPTAIGYATYDTEEEQQRQREAWTTVMRGHAVANGLPVVAVNRVGFEADPSGQTDGISSGAAVSWQVLGASFTIVRAMMRKRVWWWISTRSTARMYAAGGHSCATAASRTMEISPEDS